MDNSANSGANTRTTTPAPLHLHAGKPAVGGVGGTWPARKPTPDEGSLIQLLRQANGAKALFVSALLDEFTTYQVVGSVVDYHANDG